MNLKNHLFKVAPRYGFYFIGLFKGLVAFLFLFSSMSYGSEGDSGGFFVEPSLSYERATTKIDFPSPISDSSGSLAGFGIGAKGGMHFNQIIFGGVDLRYSLLRFIDSSVNYDARSHSYNWGPFLGAQMPVWGLRVWAGYILGGEVDPDASSGMNVAFKEPTGFRLGTGIRLQNVSVNLEYQDLKYGQTSLTEVGPFDTDVDFSGVNLRSETFLVSVSFPFEFQRTNRR